jgi:hypothetical protein
LVSWSGGVNVKEWPGATGVSCATVDDFLTGDVSEILTSLFARRRETAIGAVTGPDEPA